MKTPLSLFVIAAFLPLPKAFSQATTSPTVFIDAPAPGSAVSGTVTISGWAVDNASEVGTAISSVQVVVDGTVVGTATYGISRADVCAVYPDRPGCPNVGYSYLLNTSALSAGSHTITVTATDSDGTPDTGSSSVTVNVQAPLPAVYIDAPASGATVLGIVKISGWAVDNAAAVGTAISSVQVMVDGTVEGTATYGTNRSDVCAVYSDRPGCPNVGYSYSLNTSALSAGSHTITVTATDSDGTPDTGSSSVTVNVQAPLPAVYIDAPASGATVLGIVKISGWAVDNAAAVGTAISSVQVMVDGTVEGTATYGTNRPDVCAVYPGRPGCPNVGYTYSLNTSALSAGSHTITVMATDSDGTPDTGSSSVTVNVQAPLPAVYIDAPASGATVLGIVKISGWAVDNAAAVGTAISSVQVMVDGTVEGTATYGTNRPDVCAVYPGRPGCPNVGYTYSLNTSALSAGSHTITVMATDSDGTPDTGSFSVAVNVQPPLPTVYIDTPASGATVSGTVTVSGWAVDSAAAVGTAISSVQVMVDGNVVGTATYGISRPDVCAVYPGRLGCPNVGYSYSLDTSALSAGSHTITVTATDSDGTPDTGFLSVSVNVQPPLPTVYIDTPTSGATVSGIVAISGWAVDNAAAVGTAISSVQVMVDGNVVGAATYGISRADVCAVYPGRTGCPNVGFSYSLDTSTLTVGTHTIMVTATDSDGTPDTGSFIVAVNVQAPVHVISNVSASATNCNQATDSVGVVCTLAASTTAGNDVIVGLSWKTTTASINKVLGSDSGSFFVVYAQQRNGTGSASAVLVCRDCPALTSITPTFSDATKYELNVAEYSGVQWIGITGINSGTSTAPELTFTTGDAGDFILVETSSLGNAGVITANTGTVRQTNRTGTSSGDVAGALIENTVASPGVVTAAATIHSGPWSASGVELRTTAPITYIWPDCDLAHPCLIYHKGIPAMPLEADGPDFHIWVHPSLEHNLLKLTISHPTADSISSISDNNTNAWSTGAIATGSYLTTEVRYVCGAPAGESAITITLESAITISDIMQVSYDEYSGVDTSSCSDGTSGATDLSAGAMNPGSITTNSDGDLIYTAGIDSTGNQTNGFQSGKEMSDDSSVTIWDSMFENFMWTMSVQPSRGAINPTLYVNAMDVNLQDTWNVISQAFKASSGAGTQPPSGSAWVIRDITAWNNASSDLSLISAPTNGNALAVVSSHHEANRDLSTLHDNQGSTFTGNPTTDSAADPQQYVDCYGISGYSRDRIIAFTTGPSTTLQQLYDISGAKTSGGSAGCIGNESNHNMGAQAATNNANLVTSAFSTPFRFPAKLNGSAYSLVIVNINFGAGPPSGPCVLGGVTPPTCTSDMTDVTLDSVWATGMGDASHYTTGDAYAHYLTNSTRAISYDLLMANSVGQPGGGSAADAAAIEILGQP